MQRWLVGKKGGSEKSAFAWRTFPCVRVTVMQLRERAPTESMKIKPGRPSAGALLPSISRWRTRENAATLLAPLLHQILLWKESGTRIAELHSAWTRLSVFLPVRSVTSRHLSSPPLRPLRKKGTRLVHDDNFFITWLGATLFWKTRERIVPSTSTEMV